MSVITMKIDLAVLIGHYAICVAGTLTNTVVCEMLEVFRQDLTVLTDIQIIRKYLLSDVCKMFDSDQTLALRERVSNHFAIDYRDVVLVGSAKLGFSIAPTKRFKLFDEESDIDIALVSKVLFERVWQETFAYKESGADWPRAATFFKYLSEGWIRPDMLPSSRIFTFTGTWWDFFNDITRSREFGPYKIRAGLYHSSFFLEEYQKICIRQCRGIA